MQESGPYSSQPVIGLVCNGVIIMLGWTYLQVRSDTFLAIYSVKFWFRSLEMYQKVFIKRRIFLRFLPGYYRQTISLRNVQSAKDNKWLSCRILDLFLYKVVYGACQNKKGTVSRNISLDTCTSWRGVFVLITCKEKKRTWIRFICIFLHIS